METPKLKWIKENLPATWRRAHHFFDLPDFLTMRATGQLVRSLCSAVCKWTYRSGLENHGWSESYFRSVGLEDLADEGFVRIGTRFQPPASPIAGGLSPMAATELDLLPGTAVGTSMIDAHAGALGMLGIACAIDASQVARHVAIIAGSSACHMAVSPHHTAVPGVWGPYHSAVLPDMWLSEGGQSAAGKLLDHVIQGHRACDELHSLGTAQGKDDFSVLNEMLIKLSETRGLPMWALTTDLHILPYFHGNRSPLADSSLLGAVSGLSLSTTPLEELCILYLAALQALALGTRHILEEMNKAGHCIEAILMCGGLSHNPLYLGATADATGFPVTLSSEQDSVLVGAAILGATAAHGISLLEAMAAFATPGAVLAPNSSAAAYYDRKYRVRPQPMDLLQVFRKMHEHQLEYRDLMH
eukprot:m.179351 g.179351  ORF g.179351 m.179351 type:complete len:415 (-) comp9982_c0_seq54:1698-2942(-)